MNKTPNATILRYALISVTLLALGALFATTISTRLTREPQQASPSPSQSGEQSADGGSLEGKAAPAFAVVDLKRRPVRLEDYRGKLVFLNFWATWCEPCKKEMPSMERLYQKMKGKPFEILAISLDAAPEKDVPAFLAKTGFKLSFPLLADVDQKVSKELYRTTGVPESFIIGGDGKIIKHAIGSYEWDSPEIIEYINTQLKEVKTDPGQSGP